MANVIGCSQCEKEVLQKCPDYVKHFGDIGVFLDEFNHSLNVKKAEFNKKLPERIKEEETKLQKLDELKNEIKTKQNHKSNKLKFSIRGCAKHAKKWIYLPFHCLSFVTHNLVLFPIENQKIMNRIHIQDDYLSQWKENSDTFFNEAETDLLNRIAQLDQIKGDPLYYGAIGEIRVLNELKKLDDEYKIICGCNIDLGEYHNYEETHNLRSAQVDLLLVGFKGVFVIEVKNWSNESVNGEHHFSPHEQVDRAGRAVYLYLKQRVSHNIALGNRVRPIIVSIKDNIQYKQEYGNVLVSGVGNLNNLIKNQRDCLLDNEIDQIAKTLEPLATTY